MYLFENPVLQRELLANLRTPKAFALLAGYVGLLGGLVYLAWPQAHRVDVTNPVAAQQLISLFFLGQYLLASLLAPSFAAGAITGEKERRTYELLVSSPLRPAAVVIGKLLASLCHVALLIVASLPIVMLCLPLGGVSLYEVLANYVALLLSTVTFGMISLAASSFFRRTYAALAVSYLVILPLSLIGLMLWWMTSGAAVSVRLIGVATVMPAICFVMWSFLFSNIRRRLLYPPDLGSEGREVVDEDREQQEAVGLVIKRGQFPDSLFAPAKRIDLLPDGSNPVFDKEMRSEIFSQGTLMLRVVIQVSGALALPVMGACLYVYPFQAPWYVSYVLLFNMLVGPVFSAGSVTSERERQTLDLLLTTVLSPWMILSAKVISGLRISSVLTMFLVLPLVLGCIFVQEYWTNLLSMACYLLIILSCCLTTANVAMFCSVIFRKTSSSLLTAYLVIVILFTTPVAMSEFVRVFMQDQPFAAWFDLTTFTSPFAATFAVPLLIEEGSKALVRPANWPLVGLYFLCWLIFNLGLMAAMTRLFNTRWRVAQ